MMQPVADLLTRRLAGAVALVALAGLVLQFVFTQIDMQANGATALQASWRFVGYFTILTNMLVMVVLARVALGHRLSQSLLAGTTLAIVVVGVVYHLLLADLNPVTGWRRFADQLLHTAVPLLTLLLWIARLPRHALAWSDAPQWLLWPMGYAVYALVRAQFDGFYPYPFLDVAELGWARVGMNGLGMALAFLAAGLAMVALTRLGLRRRFG
jgi:hypothetical protein